MKQSTMGKDSEWYHSCDRTFLPKKDNPHNISNFFNPDDEKYIVMLTGFIE